RNFREKAAPPNALMAGPGAPTSATYFVTTFTFDGSGSRTAKAPDDAPATTYTWDPQERLLGVADGGKPIESAGYDAYARRTTLVEGTDSTRFLYDGAQVNNRYYEVRSSNGSGAGSRELWLGVILVGVVSQGNVECFQSDALSSVTAKT